MEHRKRILIFLTFFVCTTCLALLTASLATHRWVVAQPLRSVGVALNSSLLLPSHSDAHNAQHDKELPRKFRGEIYFGLFQGTKVLNYGLGDRTAVIWLKQEMARNPNLVTFGLWLFTILSVSIAMIFGLVGAIFSIINTVMTPVESITGVQGLFLWNALASLFCASAASTWLAQFVSTLSTNVLTEEEQHDGWSSVGRARLAYSYYLVVASGSLHLANIGLLYLATHTTRHKHRPVVDKQPEGLIMLY